MASSNIHKLSCLLSLLLACALASQGHAARLLGQRHRRSLRYHNTSVVKTFPYRECNTSTIQHPWRARLAYQEARGGDDTQVTIRLWATESNQVVNMGTLDVYVPVESNVRRFNNSFVDAFISSGPIFISNYSGIIWQAHRHVIRFPALNLSYVAAMNSSGFDLTFTFKGGSMQSLCKQSCTYAIHTGLQHCIIGSLGWAPIIVVDGPDFVMPNLPPRKQLGQ